MASQNTEKIGMKYDLIINGKYYLTMNSDRNLINPPKTVQIPVVGYSSSIGSFPFTRGDDGNYYGECEKDMEKRIRDALNKKIKSDERTHNGITKHKETEDGFFGTLHQPGQRLLNNKRLQGGRNQSVNIWRVEEQRPGVQ